MRCDISCNLWGREQVYREDLDHPSLTKVSSANPTIFLDGLKQVFSLWVIYLMGQSPPVPSMKHYTDVIMDMIASQITSLTVVYSTVYSDVDQR